MKKPSIEPDDGFDSERDANGRKTWEEWEAERDEYINNTWPHLFEILDKI